MGEGRINQLINYYSASSILSVINPFFWRGTHQSTYQLLFRFINIIPYQSVFFGEGHVNQLINYSFASFKLSVIDPIFARSISINYFKIIQIQLNFSFVFYFFNLWTTTHRVCFVGASSDRKIQQKLKSCLPTFIFNREPSIYAPMITYILLRVFFLFQSDKLHSKPSTYLTNIIIFSISFIPLFFSFYARARINQLFNHYSDWLELYIFNPVFWGKGHINQFFNLIQLIWNYPF